MIFSLKGWNHQADSQDQGTEDSNIAGIDAKRNHGPNQKLVGDRSDRNTESKRSVKVTFEKSTSPIIRLASPITMTPIPREASA